MPAVAPGLGRGQIVVEMQKARAGNVRLRVFSAAAPGPSEIVPAVEDHPVGVGEMLR